MSETKRERATGREWAGLVLLVLPMLMIASDLTVLFLALPTLGEQLEPSASQALWIVHVYGFAIAGMLVTMGRLGDRIGPRRLLLIGGAAFAVFSSLAAFSINAEMLIVARALLGVAGATLMPSLFSLLRTMFRDDAQRRLAIAIMFSAFSAGGAIGPLLGGALLERFWWGSVFLINVPFMLLLLLLGHLLLPERAERNTSSLDLASVALSVAGVLAIVYGLQELAAGEETGPESAWPDAMIAGVGVILLWLFVRRQRSLRNPLLDLGLLADRQVAALLASVLVVGVGVVGMFFLVTQYLQWVAGLSPLQAGIWTVPFIVVNIGGAMIAPWLAGRLTAAPVVAVGLGIAAVGAALLMAAASAPEAPLWAVVTAISVVGLGQGMAMALAMDLIISSAPAEKTGSVAAVQEVGGELGTALGVAAGGAVSVVVYRAAVSAAMPSAVPEATAAAALSSVHGGVSAAAGLGSEGSALLDAVHRAVALGVQVYAGLGTLLLAGAGILVMVFLVMRQRSGPKNRRTGG